MNPTHIKHPSQRGAILIVSLLLLLVLSLIGVTAVQTTALQEKMAGNMRDQNLAFQAAEAALRAGENWLAQQTAKPVSQSSCSTPPCEQVWQLNTLHEGNFLDSHWWETTSDVQVYDNATLANVKTDPQYCVELIKKGSSLVTGRGEPVPEKYIYRVTARGTGGTDDAQAILQTTYARLF